MSQGDIFRASHLTQSPNLGMSRVTPSHYSHLDNKEQYHQLMHNILESINTISTEYNIANEVAFEKLFFDYDQPNVLRDKLVETAGNEFTIKEFTSQYASLLLQYNAQYLELKANKERLTETLTLVESQYYRRGQPYHYILPDAEENTLQTTINQALSLEGEPCIKLYIYVDDNFAFKTRAHHKSSNPVINLDIDILMPKDAKKIIIEVFDAQDSENLQKELEQDDLNSTDRSDFEVDEDKIFYSKIGKTEIIIDKALQNLLVQEEFTTQKNIIYKEGEEDFMGSDGEDVFSTNSFGRLSSLGPDYKNLIQTKGKLSLTFRAELTDECLQRVQKVKQAFLKETFDQIQQLRQIIDQKRQIIMQAIEVLFYMQFDDDQGLVLDQLQMLENSFIESMSQHNQDSSRVGPFSKEPELTHKASVLSKPENQRDNPRQGRGGYAEDNYEAATTGRGSTSTRDKKIVVRMKSSQLDVINAHENNTDKPEKQRMCGCDSYCAIF
eukprot:403332703